MFITELQTMSVVHNGAKSFKYNYNNTIITIIHRL